MWSGDDAADSDILRAAYKTEPIEGSRYAGVHCEACPSTRDDISLTFIQFTRRSDLTYDYVINVDADKYFRFKYRRRSALSLLT